MDGRAYSSYKVDGLLKIFITKNYYIAFLALNTRGKILILLLLSQVLKVKILDQLCQTFTIFMRENGVSNKVKNIE